MSVVQIRLAAPVRKSIWYILLEDFFLDTQMNNSTHYKYMRECIELSQRALSEGEAPFASLVVKDDMVIARSKNNASKLPSEHAEICALNEAYTILGGKLNGCTLYTNCEPCPMCSFMIREYHVDTVVYAIPSPFVGGHSKYAILQDSEISSFTDFFTKEPTVISGLMEDEALQVFRKCTPLWMFGTDARREQKIRELALATLYSETFQRDYGDLLDGLGLSQDQLISAYANYDTHVFVYNNTVYDDLALRFALFLHYFLKDSWHQTRQELVLNYLEKVQPACIADMGFGAPTKYVFDYVLAQKKKAILVDFYEPAFQFAREAIAARYPEYDTNITMQKIDMNQHVYPQGVDCYLFQDSLEHIQNAEEYLRKIVQEVKDNTYFIFSLPIGPIIPSHTIAWDSLEEIQQWLKSCGLTIMEANTAWLNPEVDLFVRDPSVFQGGLILARK